MSGTARTVAFLNTSEFQDGQAAGSITPSDARDLIASFQPWDIVSGAPVVNLVRGTVDGAAYFVKNGGVIGIGQSTGQRQTNANVLNALFSYCITNAKYCELEPGNYEFNISTGLLMPAAGFGNYNLKFRGSRSATILTQFYNTGSSAPVLTIGDVSGTTYLDGVDIAGITLNYGITQTGLTNATALVVGAGTVGKICDIAISPGFASPPGYDGLRIGDAGSANFSMSYRDISIEGWQRHGINFAANTGSTGNKFDNIYMAASSASTASTNTQAAVTSYITFTAGAQDMEFSRLNTEWGACNKVIDCQNVTIQGLTFNAWHLEGVNFTGSSPCVINLTGSQVLINTLDIVNPFFLTANTPRLIQDWSGGGSSVTINNLSSYPQTAGKWTTPFGLYGALGDATLGNDVPGIQINGFQHINNLGPSNFQYDMHMPAASFATPLRFTRYVYGAGGSTVERALFQVSATYTHYGQHENATIIVPAAITSFTLTLAATQGATGTQAVRTGNTTHVRRLSGVGSGTLTIKDSAGTTIGTPGTTAGVDFWFIFTGTLYVAFTPVT